MFLAVSFLAALVGLGFAGAAAFLPDTGIDGTIGAFLAVLGAFSASLALGVMLAARQPFRGRGIMCGFAGIVSTLTAISAWFLMQDIVLIAMIVALVALLASSAVAQRKAFT